MLCIMLKKCAFLFIVKKIIFLLKNIPEGHRTFCVSTISNSPLHFRTVKQKCLRSSSQFIQSPGHMGEQRHGLAKDKDKTNRKENLQLMRPLRYSTVCTLAMCQD